MDETNMNAVKEEEQEPKEKKSSFLYDTISVFVTALVIIAVMFTFFVRFVGVDEQFHGSDAEPQRLADCVGNKPRH